MRGAKAIPGFSNHAQGLAVDFRTRHDGHNLGPSSSQRALWRASWFRHWLVANAGRFGFTPLSTEEWHFDHLHGSAAGASCAPHDH
jgi:LAS superfamily LD-carboxypeptidase LdcB